jgi:hypothetical protein
MTSGTTTRSRTTYRTLVIWLLGLWAILAAIAIAVTIAITLIIVISLTTP